ncbi:MAG: hypothetical protein LWW86_02320 [Micrococcales bacterium]|nr:hypothetical protein [Micrococcales bacterium]
MSEDIHVGEHTAAVRRAAPPHPGNAPRLPDPMSVLPPPPELTAAGARGLLDDARRIEAEARARTMRFDQRAASRSSLLVFVPVLLVVFAPVLPGVTLEDIQPAFVVSFIVGLKAVDWCADTGPGVTGPVRARPLPPLAVLATAVLAAVSALLALPPGAGDVAAFAAVALGLLAMSNPRLQRLRDAGVVPMVSHWGGPVWWGWTAGLTAALLIRVARLVFDLPSWATAATAAFAALAVMVPALLQGRSSGAG